MATIKPFECIRPDAACVDRVAALPYDVYNREEAAAEVKREPKSFLKIDRAETQFDDSVDTYAPEVYAKAKEKGILITFECDQAFEAVLDFNWTAEAISNVIDNAVKYTPQGGFVRLQITEYPSFLRLDISDSGVGIPEEEQAKIFGRFYRGKQSVGTDGVGIGLYLTREIINKQNGYMKVSSDENGSTFSLFLKKD